MQKIIIADDDLQIVRSIKRMLIPYYDVDEASTALQTLDMCETEQYNGIIIDVDFGPGMSGLEVVALIRQNDQKIKIIIFSAMDYSNAVRQKALELGATFVEKPLKFETIKNILEG